MEGIGSLTKTSSLIIKPPRQREQALALPEWDERAGQTQGAATPNPAAGKMRSADNAL